MSVPTSDDIRNQPKIDRPDVGASKRPVSDDEKKLIAHRYEVGLRKGESSQDLLESLSAEYGRSTRQIERYIADQREQAPSVATDPILQRKREQHWDDLAKVAGALAFNLRLLHRRDGHGNWLYEIETVRVAMRGDRKGDQVYRLTTPGIVYGGTGRLGYEMVQMYGHKLASEKRLKKVDPILAECLISHLEIPDDCWPDPTNKDWTDFTRMNVNEEAIDALEMAARRRTFEGTTCKVCLPWDVVR